jgi:hypothetical protein
MEDGELEVNAAIPAQLRAAQVFRAAPEKVLDSFYPKGE